MQVLLFCDKISLLSTQFLGSDKERKIFKKIFNFLKPFHLKTVLISENDKKAQLGKEKDMKKNWIKKVLAVAISACTLISTIGFDGKKKENNLFNPIIEINNLHYKEDMTCFLVDNDEHLFLMNDYIVTHNTRSMIADTCFIGCVLDFFL